MKEAAKLDISKSLELYEEATTLVPGGTLYARKPDEFIPGEYPIFFESGRGCRIIDVDGNEFIDFLCGYGPILLGHREKEVDDAVIRQITEKGLCLTFTQRCQNQLAARLHELIPCSEKSLFLKTGSDATTASIRIARAYTDRIKVVRYGYLGWHDWAIELKGGIPEKLYEDVYDFCYNDLDGLEALMRKHGDQTAAIIMTPVAHPTHRRMEAPLPGFLEGVRKIADRFGAVLVFDEIRTNFRLSTGGAQKLYGVSPDLCVLGKGMANGYAISAVTGKADVMMAAARDIFISATFFPNSDGMVAALKTLEILERDNVVENLWEKGGRFLQKIQALMDQYDSGAELSGFPPMFFITFRREKGGLHIRRQEAFYTRLIRKGIFMSPHHHSYLCYRHSEEDLNLTLQAIEEALADLLEKYGPYHLPAAACAGRV
ncbi:MAG: aminotransferase class III-fold pyridoxal phosphate-dependent enzyme [Deltaproteobacteria bacterium]|nr:aminotransferase class III-fold pyridoxal phosphate-dependent enzyme [Deltaproteobacteria bacterium]